MKNTAHDIDIHFGIHFKTKLEYNAFSAGKYAISRVLVCLCRFLCPPFTTHSHIPSTVHSYSHSIGQSRLCSALFKWSVLCAAAYKCHASKRPNRSFLSLFRFVPLYIRSIHIIHTNGSKMNSKCVRCDGFEQDELRDRKNARK